MLNLNKVSVAFYSINKNTSEKNWKDEGSLNLPR